MKIQMSNLLWYLNQRPVLYFATSAPPLTGTGAGSGDGGGGSGAGGGTGGSGGGTPPSTGTPAAPAAPAIDWKSAPEHFRKGYDELKTKYDKLENDFKPWQEFANTSKVGVDQLGQIHGTYQEVTTALSELGETLGYAEDEIQEAIEQNGLAKTLTWLQKRAEEGSLPGQGGDDDLAQLVEQAVQQRISPIEQRENQRLTDQANAQFEQIVRTEMVKTFQAEGVDPGAIPQPESFMLMNAASEILKYDEKALVALKKGEPGGRAAVQKAFQQAKTFLDQYYLSRSGRDRSRVQGPPQVKKPDGTGRRPTLDEMIEDPALVNAKYKPGT